MGPANATAPPGQMNAVLRHDGSSAVLASVKAFPSNGNKSTDTRKQTVLPHPSRGSLLVPTRLGHALRGNSK